MTDSLLALIPAARKGSLWLPESASSVSDSIDSAWWLVYWVSLFFFVLIVALQLYFMIRYRRRKGHKAVRTATHHLPLELTWSIVPGVIIIVLFAKGVDGYLDLRTVPVDSEKIEVVASQWNWQFIYPNGLTSQELHVPVGKNVELVMSSNDVIHSLYIPAFRVKMDIVPGRYNYLWFNATRQSVGVPGESDFSYDLYCAEFCGDQHSEMLARVYTHDQAGLDAWYEEQFRIIDTMPPVKLGKKLYRDKGCFQCHNTDATTKTGPGFAQTYRTAHEFNDGTSISAQEANENYIRESILNPHKQVRAGFRAQMPTYKGLLRDAELRGLVAYIRSLSPKYEGEPPPAGDDKAKDKSGESESDTGKSNKEKAGEDDQTGGEAAESDSGGAPAAETQQK